MSRTSNTSALTTLANSSSNVDKRRASKGSEPAAPLEVEERQRSRQHHEQ
jgi:hypothetical protein